MDIIVNGGHFSLKGGASVAALVDQLQLDLRRVAIERNLEIVPRSLYVSTLLQPGDRVEIVSFIGGG